MRNTPVSTVTATPAEAISSSSEPIVDSIVDELHQMIGSLRCAGTGRMVKAGISMTHLHILWVIEHHGELPMSRLADLLDVSLSNATGLVDRMAERGLVERVRVPGDRRVVLVRISTGGAQALDEIEAIKKDRFQSILSHLDGEQLGRCAQAFDDIRGAIAEELGPDHLAGHTHHQPAQGRD